jgi:hypothetical protein
MAVSARRTRDHDEVDSKKEDQKKEEEGLLLLLIAVIGSYVVWRVHGRQPIVPGVAGPHVAGAPRWLAPAAITVALVALLMFVLLLRRRWQRRLARRVERALLEAGVEGRHPRDRERTIKPRLRRIQRESRYVWKLAFAMPVMGSSLNLSRLVPHLEEKLDCSITPWAEDHLVWLRIGTRRLPRRTIYEDFDHRLLGGKELPISIGTSREGDLAIDLATLPHLLLGGKTGAGKSVFLRQALVRLVCERPPAELGLVLADLKGGMEFANFRHLPHLMTPVVDGIADFAKAMQVACRELDRRMELFREAGVENLAAWNREHPTQRLPYIVTVVDELAEVTIKSSWAEDGKARQANVGFLSHIARLGRAPGVHLILCTQRPDAEVVPGQIKGNMGAVLAFKAQDIVQSQILLGQGDPSAYTLPADVPGRGAWKHIDDSIQVQTPLLEMARARELLASIKRAAATWTEKEIVAGPARWNAGSGACRVLATTAPEELTPSDTASRTCDTPAIVQGAGSFDVTRLAVGRRYEFTLADGRTIAGILRALEVEQSGVAGVRLLCVNDGEEDVYLDRRQVVRARTATPRDRSFSRSTI